MFIFPRLRKKRLYRALSIALATVGTSLSLPAQTINTLFQGSWQVITPESSQLILIVKKQGRASYFWGNNSDRLVYQGNWESTETEATFTWQDNTMHKLKRTNAGFNATYFDASGREIYTESAQQIPKEILGQWAKPPTSSQALASDRDKAKNFFGIWKVGNSKDSLNYISIEKDRSAASTEAQGDNNPRGLRGAWAKQGSDLHIVWDSGHYSILREGDREFSYKRIANGTPIDADSTSFVSAARTRKDNVPSEWLSAYLHEREIYSGSIAFSSRKQARQFYRGTWIIKHADNTLERIVIGRFGGLSTSLDRTLKGDWLMNGQDIFMRWDNGMRKILSPVGLGFVMYSYKPGRPLDGIPTKVLTAAPAEIAKLTQHLKGREAVADHMLELANAAGIETTNEDKGWGRTFMRWAWPFESKKEAEVESANEIVSAQNDDPWWWPFWSENPEISTSQGEDTLENQPTTETISDPNLDPKPNLDGSGAKKAKKTWLWPF
ncbi:MAG: hypothetical protein VXZ08_05270 [Verrucomicrobiota bacterium]|nr:hypothetical protein [Verrucomicrobiota bacterium]